MRRGHGYTLIEVLVMASVSLVVLGLLASVFLTALRRSQDGRIRVDLQQSAVFSLSRWEKDIERASYESVAVQPGAPYLVGVTGATGVAGNGTVAWEPTLARWTFNAEARTLSRAICLRPESLGYAPTPTALAGLVIKPGEEERGMCEDVDDFALNKMFTLGEDKTPRIVLRLVLRRALSTSERETKFTLERTYTLRNSF